METQIKVLDKDAFEYLKAEKQKGRFYDTICIDLKANGYTNKFGNELKPLDISVFACANGFRSVKKHSKNKIKNIKKILNDSCLEEIKQMRINRMTIVDIAKEFNQRGFTGKGGGLIHGTDISKFLNKYGMRTRGHFTRQTFKSFTVTPHAAEVRPPQFRQEFISTTENGVDNFIAYVTKTKDINSSQKAKVLQLFI